MNPDDSPRKDGHFPPSTGADAEPRVSELHDRPREKPASTESWVALCAQAAVEQDPKRLLDLVSEINRLLDARKKRLSRGTP